MKITDIEYPLIDNQKKAEALLLEFTDPSGRYTTSVDKFKHETTTVFPGDLYKNKTQLKTKRGLFNKIPVAQQTKATILKKFDPIFIIGYQLDNSGLFYEIWYDPYIGKYVVANKFGNHVGKEKDLLSDIVDEFANVIIKSGEKIDEPKSEREFERESKRNMRKKRYDRKEFDTADAFRFESEKPDYINDLLNETINTRKMLHDMINDEVTEYERTRAKKHTMNFILKKMFGREFPEDYIAKGVSQKGIEKITGGHKEATFVTGYSFSGKIDIEIWFIKDTKGNEDSFYVFDLKSGTLIGSNIRTLRDAVKVISSKITLPKIA